MKKLNPDIPKMQTKRTQRLDFKRLIYFLLLKGLFEPRFFFVDYGRGPNNLVTTAFLLFDMKDEGINTC